MLREVQKEALRKMELKCYVRRIKTALEMLGEALRKMQLKTSSGSIKTALKMCLTVPLSAFYAFLEGRETWGHCFCKQLCYDFHLPLLEYKEGEF